MVITLVVLWLLGIGSYLYYESTYGFGFDFNSKEDLIFSSFVWHIAIPVILIRGFFKRLDVIKHNRKVKEKEQQKIRLKTEADLKEALELVEEEFSPYEKEEKQSK